MITNDLLCARDNKRRSLRIMFDQPAALDTVNLDILLQRRERRYSITSSALSRLKTYYSGPSEIVSVCGDTSDSVTFRTSFPQGSVLGIFQYPIYTLPLFCVANTGNVSMHVNAGDIGRIVDISNSARNIGAVLDGDLSAVEHVKSVTRVCCIKL